MERVEMALMTFKHGREQLLFTFNNGRRFWLESDGRLEEWDKKKECGTHCGRATPTARKDK